MFSLLDNSPYTKRSDRLADVIAAIQVMSTYKFYKLTFNGWAERITGAEANGVYWRGVFEDHPEFFRMDGKREKASLVWRRQYPRRYHVDLERTLRTEELDALSKEERSERISRVPLQPNDIKLLVDAAINLHTRALEFQKDRRWWVILFLTVIGSIAGSVIASYIKSEPPSIRQNDRTPVPEKTSSP
ncbi:MAG TPA: hypothetical protein VG796_03735 [Verrucomicrobiales bacterium]|nr:hypothetical protein [Verrucomicrobiales bacterium]